MSIGAHCNEEDDLQPIYIRGDSLEAVKEFGYLGSIVASRGDILVDVENRIDVPRELLKL